MTCLSLRSAVLASLLLGAAALPSVAAPIQHEGVVQPVAPLSTYGMQVDIERALRGVVPTDWQVVVDSGNALSGRVSWGPTDTWLDVLKRIADGSQVDVRVDWDTREVIVSEPKATPEGTANIASKKVESHVSEGTLERSSPEAVAREMVDKVAESVSTEKPSEQARVSVSSASAESKVSPAGPARAFNRTPLRAPLEALAERYGLTLIYNMEHVVLPGAVTLMLDGNLAGDIDLLHRALGQHTRLEIVEYRSEKELVVTPGISNSFVSLEARPAIEERVPFFARIFTKKVPARPVVIPSEPEGDVTDDVAASSAVAVEAPVEVVTATVTPPDMGLPVEPLAEPVVAQAFVLELAQGERLSSAMERMLLSINWRLVWRAPMDLEAEAPVRIEGASLSEVLERVLPELGLAADLYNPSRTAVIRNSHETVSQGAP